MFDSLLREKIVPLLESHFFEAEERFEILTVYDSN